MPCLIIQEDLNAGSVHRLLALTNLKLSIVIAVFCLFVFLCYIRLGFRKHQMIQHFYRFHLYCLTKPALPVGGIERSHSLNSFAKDDRRLPPLFTVERRVISYMEIYAAKHLKRKKLSKSAALILQRP